MKYSGIPIANGFKVTGKGLPIDDRIILSKEDMAKTLLPYSKENPLPYYLPDHYFAVCSDDGKLYLYDKINNPPSQETGYFKVLEADGQSNTVWQGDKLEGETDSEAIERIIGTDIPKNGDVIILRTLIEDDKYSYKSFIFNNVWKAMDGNYDAENVYFRDNIVAAGTYDKVGNVTKGEVILAAGKSVKDIFSAIFTKELIPTIIQPSIKIVSFLGGAKEVGTQLSPSYSIELLPGNYSFGPDTAITATSYSAIDSLGNTMITPSGILPELTISDNLDYYVNFSASYSDGAVPLTNLGNDYIAGKIIAGTKTAQSNHITGFRSYFYGSVTTPSENIDSKFIRNLINSEAKLNDTETIIEAVPISAGAKQVIIAFPTASGKNLLSVKDLGAFGADIVSRFERRVVQVEGANGYTSISYDVYVYNTAVALNENTYKVIIG